ncbi:hypothetical protein [Paenibacillus aquistagni]|uniref:hypothetical protein n=1 Tax=Paenibacillus aquistagni TaxID=1852522 RepID=UPI000B5042B5|nr:hypothetical protein [Paenibacillus aquistagni]NMM54986.1 hypothetical protein [Paenibacillus aquistagni]
MNTFDNLRKRINETDDVIRKIEQNYSVLKLPDFVSNLEISSLNMRKIDLERDLERESKAQQSEQLEVKLYPKNLPSGAVPVRTLVEVLGGLQDLTDSVANTLLNQPSNRGPIPQEILEGNSWVLTNVKAGSFIAELNLDHDLLLSLEDTEIPQKTIIGELFSLFNASDEEESLLEVISGLGGRTLKYYMEWSKKLRELDTPIDLNWVSSESISNQIIKFDPEKAERIFKVLNEKLASYEEEFTLTGRLTGVNVRTSTFEFEFFDKGSERKDTIYGRIQKNTIVPAVDFLDKKCRVDLLKITTKSSAGREKIAWNLKDVNKPEYN